MVPLLGTGPSGWSHSKLEKINATSAATSSLDGDLPLTGTSRFKHHRFKEVATSSAAWTG